MSDETPLNEPPTGASSFNDPAFGADQSFDDPGLGPPNLDRAPATLTGWSTPAVVIGAAIVAIAVSGMLDDTGLATHPYWVVPAIGLFSACAAIASQTLRRLVTAGG